jgi:hypothetical protein
MSTPMSTPTHTRMRGGALPGVWALRGILVAGLLLALLAGIPEDYTPPVVLVMVVAAASVLSAFRPEHLVVSITMGVVIVWWGLQLHTEMPVAVLVVAAALLGSHVAATLLAYGPTSLAIDPALAVLWTMRAALTWTAGLAVWAVARAYAGHGSPGTFWLTGLAAALVGAIVAAIATPIRGKEARR